MPDAYTRSEVMPKFMSPFVVLSLAALYVGLLWCSLFPLKINSFNASFENKFFDVSFENKFLLLYTGITLTVES